MIELQIDQKLKTTDFNSTIVGAQLIFTGQGTQYYVNLDEKVSFKSIGNQFYRINSSNATPDFIVKYESPNGHKLTAEITANHAFPGGNSYDGIKIGSDSFRAEMDNMAFSLQSEVSLQLIAEELVVENYVN